jgi:hypothetical protein
MACKKSELISAINSFGAARASGDINLINFAGNLVGNLVQTLEFSPEEEEVEGEEVEAEIFE